MDPRPPQPDTQRAFRRLLQEELARRCDDNPQYSLRAFARRLDVHHATLSQILRGRRPISRRTLRALGCKLGLTDAQLASYEDARKSPTPEVDLEAARLARDAAAVITGWKHLALLDLLRLQSFRPDVRWIARMLGLLPDEVNEVVARLCRLKLLALHGERWEDLSGDATTSPEALGAVTARRLSALLPQRAADVLDLQSPSDATRSSAAHGQRPPDFASPPVLTLATESARLPAAQALLERCRVELLALLGQAGTPDVVIQLGLHLQPLTHPRDPMSDVPCRDP